MSDIVYFNTSNEAKEIEIKILFKNIINNVRVMRNKITEILSTDLNEVILDKAAQAYKIHRIPIIVEHAALCIDYLNGYPGALSKPMWELLGDEICKLVPEGKTRKAVARSAVCYCDGRKRVIVTEETEGELTLEARGTYGFQWDPIFIPEGQKKTYAEMPPEKKLEYSQAAKAYKKLRKMLNI